MANKKKYKNPVRWIMISEKETIAELDKIANDHPYKSRNDIVNEIVCELIKEFAKQKMLNNKLN